MNPIIPFLLLIGGLMAGGASSGGSTRPATRSDDDDHTPEPVEVDEGADETPVPSEDDDIVEEPGPTPPPPPPVGDQNDYDGPDAPGPTVISGDQVTVMTGRVTTLQPETNGEVSSIRILEKPEIGNLTVNPDNTLALVLTGETGTGAMSFRYEVGYTDGSSEIVEIPLDVTAGLQADGWGIGDFYMLETDDNDRIVVEHGENHRPVYISGSDDALTKADIAALEGLTVDQITRWWLADNPEYGGSEGMALAPDVGMELWNFVTGGSLVEPNSNWLLLERGFEYDIGFVIDRGTIGESELHPVYVGAWGEGENPVVTSLFGAFMDLGTKDPSSNIVIQDITFVGGGNVLGANSLLMDNIEVTENGFAIQGVDPGSGHYITIRNSSFYDIFREASLNGGDWDPHADRVSGFYGGKLEGLLLEGNFFDHVGWADDYTYYGDESGGQPPSMWNHSIYLQFDNSDVTLRDSIIMQGASFGAQVRSGGFIEDNLFLDNNAQVNFLGGYANSEGGPGNYTLFSGNVVTSAGHKEANLIGAYSLGVDDGGHMSTLIGNIITHLADPNNPVEQAEKDVSNTALQHTVGTTYYDDTIVYNWGTNPDLNTGGLDTSILDQTTIQIFTAQLLGQPSATVSDLADFLRAQADGALDGYVDADIINAFFREGFGLETDIRGAAETLRFIPNDLGDGVRWDNDLNWSTGDLPGTQDGDSVDLGGNWVNYSGTTVIENLELGDGGELRVHQGKLTVEAELSTGAGGRIDIDRAGQFWTDGYTADDLLDIDVNGGRFANTGQFDGKVDMDISDNGQAILATGGAAFDLAAESSLSLHGDDIRVGFDGEDGGTAVFRMDEGSRLEFNAEDGGIATIREFYSGAFGSGTDVQSGVNLGGGTLALDVTGLSAGTQTLISVDALAGDLGNLELIGLGSRNATLTIDHDTDTVKLTLTASGTGQVNIERLGDMTGADESAELWAALTGNYGVYSEEPPLPEEDDPDALALAA